MHATIYNYTPCTVYTVKHTINYCNLYNYIILHPYYKYSCVYSILIPIVVSISILYKLQLYTLCILQGCLDGKNSLC